MYKETRSIKAVKTYRILSSVSYTIQYMTSFEHLIYRNTGEVSLRFRNHMDRSVGTVMQRNEHLRRQRIERNWRQQDLADLLGTTVTTIQRWERGHQQPSAYYRVKLCTLFGLDAQELGLVETFASPPERTEVTEIENTLPEEISLWTVPYARNPHFTGRDDLLQQLGQVFSSENPGQPMSIQQAALTQTQAITGLGGIGKTQIAIEYAYRARMQGRYRHTMWISAGSSETILTSFVELARLYMPTLVEKEGTNQRNIVGTLLRWLEQCMQPWLLIFDNADDLSLVQPYLPRWGNGCMLITTRAHAVGAFASSLEVDSMGVMEATHLLLRRAHRFSTNSPEELDEAIMLVNALAQFPLAIDQAGAYIEETGCTLSTYLQLYQRYRHALLARRGGQATGYPESVVTTWSLSFAQVERTNPAAAELLQLCAFLAPDHIPEELLTEGAPYWPARLREAVTNPLSFNQVLETLLAFSLVKRLSEDRMLSLHRLVQIVQLERMEAEVHLTWAQRLVRAMHAIFPQDTQDVATWPRCQRYLEQVEACDVLIERHHLQLPEAADLLDRAGTYVREHMWYAQAEPLYRRALAIREQYLGPEHPYTANALSNLANLYLAQRRYREAEPLYRRALAIREHHFGPPDPDSDDHLHTLANFYVTQGHYREAESLYQRILAIREQRLGPLHYRTANILNNLAVLYITQARYGEAEPLYGRVLTIREQQFGPTHPHTATSLYNLAMLQRDKGNFVEAEPLYQRALVIREQHLGKTHPTLADCLGGLATLYQKQRRVEQAETLALRALRIHEQHLGPLHPSTADDLHTLAILYRDQGKPAEAESLFLRAISIREKAFVSTHLSLAETLNEFALLLHAQGHHHEARPLYEHALAARIHILGATHPLTITVHDRLIALLQTIGCTEEAAQLDGAPPRSVDLPREETLDRSDRSMDQIAGTSSTWESVLPVCPQCHRMEEIIKSGKNRSGSQRFRCRACHLYFTPQPNIRQPEQMRKAEALALAEHGMSYRHIARQLGVHHQTVSAWISAHGERGRV
jgi:tetratricopeptide (TPR) repeat protein/transposase-like protein/transcriptional regulator with XRE-family HTH domain